MKRLLLAVMILTLALAVGCGSQRYNSASSGGAAATSNVSGDQAEAIDRLNDASEILNEIMGAPDAGIPTEVLDGANCVAVVPSMIKGGFVFGGKHGRGVATCREAGKWSAPAFFTISGGNWGPQIGVESVDLVLLVMNDNGMQALLENNLELSGNASVAAGPVGRTAKAGMDWKAETGVLAYSRSKGLFAGLTLDGANIRQDKDSIRGFYGQEYNFRQLLAGGIKAPAAAQGFVNTVAKYFRFAKASD